MNLSNKGGSQLYGSFGTESGKKGVMRKAMRTGTRAACGKVPVVLSLLLLGACASQVTFNVTTTADLVDANPGDGTCVAANGACSLRAALQEVNALPAASNNFRIRLLNSGTYELTLDVGGNEGLVLEPPTRNVEIVGCCSTAAQTTIRQTLKSRIFTVRGGALTLRRVLLREGRAPDTPADSGTVKDGGAIHMSGAGILRVIDCILEDNVAGQKGGAVFVASDSVTRLDVIDSIIRNNSASVAGVGGAGGVHSGATTTVSNTLFEGNEGNGGGLRLEDASAIGGPPAHEILRSTFFNNQSPNSGGGGGLRVDIGNDELTIIGSTFSTNSTTGTSGAAVGITSGTVEIRDTTMTRNQAAGPSGHAILVGAGAELRLGSTLIAQNPTSALGVDPQIECGLGSPVVLLGFNLIDGVAVNCALDDVSLADQDDVGADAPIDAGLSFYISTPIGHHPLQEDSPAIDYGAFFCNGVDQIGNAKPVDGDDDGLSRCDVGSIEFQGT